VKPVRYSYGITAALLGCGAAISLITGQPAGAQVAQSEQVRAQNAVPSAGAPASFADLTQILQPAVVNISPRQSITGESPMALLFGRRSTPQRREGQSLGSGFLVSADGYVVTNNHVVAPDARATLEEVTVTLPDGQEYEAELVGTDPSSDLAVLKISRSEPFPFVNFGKSGEARVGEWVIAIGNPFGLGGTVTSGIISAVARNTGRGDAFDRYIQTDASINRGNSGGPLFDMKGDVIGINNAIFSPSGGSVGIGFAIPADTAAPIVQSLIDGEEILRGYLGVRIQPVDDDMAEALGIDENRGEIIQMVQPGEAAEQAGLRADDVVLQVDGQDVTPDNTLSFIVANIAPGTQVPIRFIRNGREQMVNATIGRRPSEEELRQESMFNGDDEPTAPTPDEGEGVLEEILGIRAIPVTPQVARQLNVPADTQGVAITAVDPNTDAARKGLGRGVIVLQANGTDIASIADLETVLRDARAEGRGAILIRARPRGGQPQSVAVRLIEE